MLKLIFFLYKYYYQQVTTMNSTLPQAITALIYEFSDAQGYWKNRFSNDILPSINKGYHLVGMYCHEHEFEGSCDCEEQLPCANCYSYGDSLCSHDRYDSISYDTIKPLHRVFIGNPYIPYEHWAYFQGKHKKYFESGGVYAGLKQVLTYSDTIEPILKQLKTA